MSLGVSPRNPAGIHCCVCKSGDNHTQTERANSRKGKFVLFVRINLVVVVLPLSLSPLWRWWWSLCSVGLSHQAGCFVSQLVVRPPEFNTGHPTISRKLVPFFPWKNGCQNVEFLAMKTRRTALLQYTTLSSPNAFGHLGFIRVSEAASGFLINNTLICNVIDISMQNFNFSFFFFKHNI